MSLHLKIDALFINMIPADGTGYMFIIHAQIRCSQYPDEIIYPSQTFPICVIRTHRALQTKMDVVETDLW